MNASVDDAREFVAESRDEALAKAAGFFRVSAEELEVWVVPDTVTVSGLGANVLLIAAPRSARPAAREDRRPEQRPQQRQERRDERPARPERAERPARSERPERSEPREARPRPERSAPPARAPRAAPEPVDDSTEDLEDGELGPVGEFIAGILERMKLRGVAVTETETEEGDIIITLDGKAITALNDREPRFAAAISHLAHRAAEMLIDDEVAARVDIRGASRPPLDDRDERPRGDNRRDGNRGGRPDARRDSDDRDIDEVALERMAREAAEIVRRSGEPELLRPMNSRERWVVHNTLKDERGVRSESEGDGPRKRVRITPD